MQGDHAKSNASGDLRTAFIEQVLLRSKKDVHLEPLVPVIALVNRISQFQDVSREFYGDAALCVRVSVAVEMPDDPFSCVLFRNLLAATRQAFPAIEIVEKRGRSRTFVAPAQGSDKISA